MNLPLYSLTIASELVGLHPRTIMNYEKLGFLKPARSRGNKRLYSNEDLKILLMIKHLRTEEQLNLPALKLLFDKNLTTTLFADFDASKRLREILDEI